MDVHIQLEAETFKLFRKLIVQITHHLQNLDIRRKIPGRGPNALPPILDGNLLLSAISSLLHFLRFRTGGIVRALSPTPILLSGSFTLATVSIGRQDDRIAAGRGGLSSVRITSVLDLLNLRRSALTFSDLRFGRR